MFPTIQVHADEVCWAGDLLAVDDGRNLVVLTPDLQRVRSHPYVRDAEGGFAGFDLGGDRLLRFGEEQVRVVDARTGRHHADPVAVTASRLRLSSAPYSPSRIVNQSV